ncbi:unnamed protein product [Moneuplotes crassus]|uniref:Calmodulin n=1 Tax=Euplotes crassus TaxID=5936 RepID=A0AAD1XP06_EUPCR|nr:unnamed protein product [Moneuplotes crassus]
MSLEDAFDKYELEEFRDAFNSFDKDSSGVISTLDLKSVMRHIGENPVDALVDDLVNQIGAGDKETLTFLDFLAIMAKKMGKGETTTETEDELIEIFSFTDSNGDCLISIDELREIIHERRKKVSDEELNELLKKFDSGKDDHVDFEMFYNIMMETA